MNSQPSPSTAQQQKGSNTVLLFLWADTTQFTSSSPSLRSHFSDINVGDLSEAKSRASPAPATGRVDSASGSLRLTRAANWRDRSGEKWRIRRTRHSAKCYWTKSLRSSWSSIRLSSKKLAARMASASWRCSLPSASSTTSMVNSDIFIYIRIYIYMYICMYILYMC